jgi:hypothetical protein
MRKGVPLAPEILPVRHSGEVSTNGGTKVAQSRISPATASL